MQYMVYIATYIKNTSSELFTEQNKLIRDVYYVNQYYL